MDGRFPALRDGLQLPYTSLSLVLLCGGLGAILSYPFTSRMMARCGSRKTVLYAGWAILLVLMAISLAPNVPSMMLAVLALGITASCFDVLVNSAATRQEQTGRRPLLSRMHAWGCAGCLMGPPMMGTVAHLIGIQADVGFIACLALAIAGFARRSRMLK